MNLRDGAVAFDVTVGASPSGKLNIDHEIGVLKPALLYGDTVTLLSPAISSSRLLMDSHSLSFRDAMEQTASFMAKHDPASAAEARAYVEERDRLAGLQWRTESERRRWASLLEMEEQYESQKVERRSQVPTSVLDMAGFESLRAAEEAGVLQIEQIMAPTDLHQAGDVEAHMQAYLARLLQNLSNGTSYPLFDDFSGLMVKAAEIDGLFTPVQLIDSRGKQVGMASHLMRRLPVFPNATVADKLDVRRELEEPLVRFRAAMIDFAGNIEVVAYDSDFGQNVEELARARVDPAMLEIEELVRQNKYLSHFQKKAVTNLQSVGPILTVGVSLLTDLPVLAGPALAMLQALWDAELERRKQQNEIRQHQLYLLYRTNELLSQA